MHIRSFSLAALLAAGTLVHTGCISTQTIPLDGATDSTFAEINAQGQRRQARVLLARQPPLTVAGLRVTTDSTFWLSPRTGRELMAPTAQLQEVQFKKSRIWKGAVLGAAIGVGLGLALGNDCTGAPPEEGCISRLDLLPMGILAGGLIGGIFGTRGAVRYRFDHTRLRARD